MAVGKTALCPPYGRAILIEDIKAIISCMKHFLKNSHQERPMSHRLLYYGIMVGYSNCD